MQYPSHASPSAECDKKLSKTTIILKQKPLTSISTTASDPYLVSGPACPSTSALQTTDDNTLLNEHCTNY